MIFGVGINDSLTPVSHRKRVDGRYVSLWVCPFYSSWASMLSRCYSKKIKSKHPTYNECIVSDEWKRFSSYKKWMEGEKWQGMHLDKDILVPGNKVYGPDTCVFVSQKLNKFITDSGFTRGQYPIGVDLDRKSGSYRSRCQDPFSGACESLGSFSSPEEAHEAWRKRKHEHACRYADMQTDQRIADALRSRYAKKEDQVSS